MEQKIITSKNEYQGLEEWMERVPGNGPILFVHGKSILKSSTFPQMIEELSRKKGIKVITFSGYQPNPLYESVVEGVKRFREEGCTAIIAAGGGSAIDTAKCIKLYANMPGDGEDGAFLRQQIIPADIPFLVMPTTAGTGSEATRYAVIYYDGKKQSVTSESCIPDTVFFDPDCLKFLPSYQKKATMCDALCHAVESFWSVNSTEESKDFSRDAIREVLAYMDGCLANTDEGNAGMLHAANLAGKAINITQTTAGHAMCYKISGLFGCAHGHAAMLCDRVLYRWMTGNAENCTDPRGQAYLEKTLDEIGQAMGCKDRFSGAEKLLTLFDALELEVPSASEAQFEELTTSVNPDRLKNHPIALNESTINELYHEILR